MSDLLARLKNHRAMMAPHQKEREAGKLLIEAIAEIEQLLAANKNSNGHIGELSNQLAAKFKENERLIKERDSWTFNAQQLQKQVNGWEPERAALKEELAELAAGYELRSKADARAIEMWQKAHPDKPLTWPGHADLVVWLLEEMEKGK